jgi:hypothetical protein
MTARGESTGHGKQTLVDFDLLTSKDKPRGWSSGRDTEWCGNGKEVKTL